MSAGLGEDIIERSLGDLNGFVEHLEEYKISRKDICSKRDGCWIGQESKCFPKATIWDMPFK